MFYIVKTNYIINIHRKSEKPKSVKYFFYPHIFNIFIYMKKNTPIEVQREGSLSIIQFNKLATIDKNLYLLDLFEVPLEQRTSVDKHILKFFNLNINSIQNNFEYSV
jgi:hypothetical protein